MLCNVNIAGTLSTTSNEEIARNPYAPEGFRRRLERGLLYFYHGLLVCGTMQHHRHSTLDRLYRKVDEPQCHNNDTAGPSGAI